MIIKANLASRPTQNHSLYFLGCMLLAVGLVAFTTYNLKTLVSSFEKTSELNRKITEQQKLRGEAQKQSAELRRKIAAIKTPEFVKETEFLNNAINRRVFSWTALFDHLEAVFPNNVKMMSVFPDISGDETKIRMEVSVRSLNDIVELTRSLQASPYFTYVVVRSETQEKDSMLHFSISLNYIAEPSQKGQKEASAPEKKTAAATKKTVTSTPEKAL